MDNCPNPSQTEGKQKQKRIVRASKRWTVKEKKIVLHILKKHGHDNVNKFIEALPKKKPNHIYQYLKRFKRMAAAKLKMKHYDTQNDLTNTHQWLPFINVYCDAEATLYRNLPALILPIFEKYAKHPNARNTGNVDFKKAYRFLFNSLNNKLVEEDINKETLAMLFISFNQLLEEIRSDTSEVNVAFKNAINRILQRTNSLSRSQKIHANGENDVLKMPEVNALFLNDDEVEVLCRNKK